MNKEGLKKFLETGVAPAAPVVVSAEVVGIEKSDPVMELLSNLFAVTMLAKDLHYRARGKAFYAIHLLADLVWESRREADELIEVYYLGETQSVPPLMSEICRRAVGKVKFALDTAGVPMPVAEDKLLSALVNRCKAVAGCVEEAKSLALRSGTNAVLDEISKKALQNIGLLSRTEQPAPPAHEPVPPAAPVAAAE